MDTGVSVRKRVIKIIRDLYISRCDFAKRTDALVRILTRINDEETSIQVKSCFISMYLRVVYIKEFSVNEFTNFKEFYLLLRIPSVLFEFSKLFDFVEPF